MSAGPAPAHRERVRRSATTAPPRRVSGPARRPAAFPYPGPTPPPSPGAPTPGARWGEALRALPDARWVDRLLRGRAWIALIALALIGIVAMQVHLLKLNAGIGRAVEHSATLDRQNAELRASVAKLSSQERIQGAAQQLGMVMAPAGDVRYVETRAGRDARRAARVMRTPNSLEQLAAARLALAQQQAALGIVPPATPPAGTAAAGAVTPGAAAPTATGTGTTAPAAPPATGTGAATTTTTPPAAAPTAPTPTAAATATAGQ